MENYQIDKYIQDGQDPKVVEKIHGKILDMLTPGESINYIALQKKPAVTLLPDSITVSNKRLFLCEFTKLGLATNFEIFAWQEVKDIAFKEEIFGSKVTVIPFTGENLTIDGIGIMNIQFIRTGTTVTTTVLHAGHITVIHIAVIHIAMVHVSMIHIAHHPAMSPHTPHSLRTIFFTQHHHALHIQAHIHHQMEFTAI